jgi:broad specificity phosphatase PhoE
MQTSTPSTAIRRFETFRHEHDTSTHLYLIRHGQTEANVRHQLAGHLDVPLDDLGVQQAKQVGLRMKEVRLDAIISSPLQRARITASEVAAHQRMDLVLEERLREIHFGHAEGLTLAEAADRFPELLRLRDNPFDDQFGWPGGDVRADFNLRIFSTISEIAYTWRERHVAIVCHGGVIGSFIAQLDGGSPNDYESYPIANCSVTHLEVTSSGTMAHLLNDIAHLDVVRTEPFNYATMVANTSDGQG